MEALQIIILLFALFALSRVILRFKERKKTSAMLFAWGVLWIALIILSFTPALLTLLSRTLGIGRGIDVIVYTSIVLLFYLLFRSYMQIVSVEQKITFLVREIALLKATNAPRAQATSKKTAAKRNKDGE